MVLFKLFLSVFFLFVWFFSNFTINAADPKAYQNYQPVGSDIAYTIVVPGEQLPDGKFSPTKIQHINKVDKEHYLPNAIHVKTKKYIHVDKNAKGFRSSILQSSISDISVTSVRAPFAHFASGDLQSVDEVGISRIYEIYYDSPVDPYDLCKELIKNPDVEYAVPIFRNYLHDYNPNDPRYFSQWGVKKIECPKAWEITQGDKNVIIANVDTGTDWDHEDLAANIYSNPNEIPGNSIDDDNNNFVDDIRGWDFVGNVTSQQAQSGLWSPDNNPDNNGNTHGTHTSGCASAVTDNGVGVAGVGFNCSILPIKCASDNAQAPGVFRGYEGIVYAANMGADVINCSWGGSGYSPAAQDIINQVTIMGSVVCTSAGNDGTNNDVIGAYPASYENVLSVGASTATDGPAMNWGMSVTVYAPGVNIMSTLTNNRYANQSGTSMSSPICAGVVGLVKSIHGSWTPKQVIHQIRSTSDNVLVPNNPEFRPFYYGRLNAAKAVEYNLDATTPEIPGIEMTQNTFVSGTSLTDYTPKEINIKIMNYLADAENLNVRITPIDDFVEVINESHDIGTLGSMSTDEFNVQIRLKENCPWYLGNAQLLITFTSGSYVNYQLLKLPVNIPSENSHNTINFYVNPQYATQWHSSSSNTTNSFWAVGQAQAVSNAGVFFRYGNNGTIYSQASNDPLYCVWAFDENHAIAGTGPTNQMAELYTTVNGGTNWTSQSVSSITNFVNEIYFYDDQNGILLGDPVGGHWGIGTTSDGGQTWQLVNGVPQFQTQETGYVGCDSWVGDNIWFGTSRGRVFKSTDRGQTWSESTIRSGSHVVYVAFKDDQNGMAIFTESSDLQNSDRSAAYTTDGGVSWNTSIYNFTSNNYIPIYLFAPDNYDIVAVMYTGGEVMATRGAGYSWEPILTRQFLGAIDGTHILNGNYCRLWNLSRDGTRISYLDFKNLTVGVTEKELEILGEINFTCSPNPASEEVKLAFDAEGGEYIDIGIYDVKGGLVKNVNSGLNHSNRFEETINVSDLASGVYYFNIRVGERVYTYSFAVYR